MKLATVALAAAAVAAAVVNVEAASLKELVKGSLEEAAAAEVAVEAEGVNNCQNKCYNLLGYLSYYTAKQQMVSKGGNNEYRACQLGCNQCVSNQEKNDPDQSCFDYCKQYNYAGENPPIQKGVIEPDKACIIGCVIQLCQVVCTGSNPWQGNNAPEGGCQIQSGYGISTYNVGNTGSNFAPCCTPLQNLCTYKGTIPNPNYNSILNQAYQTCSGSTIGGVKITKSTSVADMCTAYENSYTKQPQQCGSPQPVSG